MIEATKKMLKDWKDFSGRMNRADYWWSYLGAFLLDLALMILPAIFFIIAAIVDESNFLWGVAFISCIPVCVAIIFIAIAMLAAEIRRLRDAGFPWWAIFVSLVPTVGSIALIVFLCLPTTDKSVLDNFKSKDEQAQPTYTAPAPAAPVVDVAPEDAPVVENNVWYCPNCGAENSANFCASCGTKKP